MTYEYDDLPEPNFYEPILEDIEHDESPAPDTSKAPFIKQRIQGPAVNEARDIDADIHLNAAGEMFLHKYKVLRDKFNNIYIYDEEQGFWDDTTDKNLKGLAMNVDTKSKTTNARRQEIVNYALDRCSLNRVNWNNIESDEVPFKDGIYKITTGERFPHSYDKFLNSVIPHNYNPSAECPRWLQCLDEWFETEDKKLALQEFFGYILCAKAKYKKALLLLGESNTGKSKVAEVAELMVGAHATSCIPINKMDDMTVLAGLKGKLLNLNTETGVDDEIADAGFKKIVANENIQINEKYARVEVVVPIAKHIIATNNLPRIKDESMAVYNRLLIIRFNRVVQQIDTSLPAKLAKEVEGIVNWAVEGAKRLIANGGQFTPVQESLEILKEYRRSQNPVLGFLEEEDSEFERTKNEDDFVSIQEFHEKFNKWKEINPWTKRGLGAALKKIGIEGKTKYVKGKTIKVYVGIRPRPKKEIK